MKDRILKGWTFRRALYAALGIFVVIQGINTGEWIAVLPGIYFSAMGIFNFGCAAGFCGVPLSSSHKEKTTEVVFEEVKSK